MYYYLFGPIQVYSCNYNGQNIIRSMHISCIYYIRTIEEINSRVFNAIELLLIDSIQCVDSL